MPAARIGPVSWLGRWTSTVPATAGEIVHYQGGKCSVLWRACQAGRPKNCVTIRGARGFARQGGDDAQDEDGNCISAHQQRAAWSNYFLLGSSVGLTYVMAN